MSSPDITSQMQYIILHHDTSHLHVTSCCIAGLAASSFGGAHGVLVAIGGRRGGSSRHVSKVASGTTV